MKSKNWVLFFGIFLPFFTFAQTNYCNGQARIVQGDPVYANGRRLQLAGDALYPNGVRTVQIGALVYPNGQRMKIGDEEYHMSGQRVSLLGDLYYPNGQRVQIAGDCFFQSGAKMNKCPARVRFEELNEGVFSTGWMDLKSQKVVERFFEFKEVGLTTLWKVDDDGSIYDLQTRCDQSLL